MVQALTQFGEGSARCERAASKILPPSRELEEAAVAQRCDPQFGIYVCPKRKWFYHVNVRVVSHCVDALTGPCGAEEEEYLRAHWPDQDAVEWRDLTDDELEGLCGWTLTSS